MTKVVKNLLLIGDPSWDRFVLEVPVIGEKLDEDWLHHQRWESWDVAGGSQMTAKMLKQLNIDVDAILSDSRSTTTMVASLAKLKFVNESQKFADRAKWELRIDRMDGYSRAKSPIKLPKLSPFRADKDYSFVLINDAGSKIRDAKELWSSALDAAMKGGAACQALVFKMHLPLMEGALWKTFSTKTDAVKIVHVHAEDLRTNQVQLSRGFSWESLVRDLSFAWSEDGGTIPGLMKNCDHLVVQFDTEAVAIFSKHEMQKPLTLIFEASRSEGERERVSDGSIFGKMNCFVSSFVSQLPDTLSKDDPKPLLSAAEKALAELAYFADQPITLSKGRLVWPKISSESKYRSNYLTKSIALPAVTPIILSNLTDPGAILDMAVDVVERGARQLENIPSGRFGNLTTVDRKEIEGLRAIDTLFKRYLAQEKKTKPISIAVFGPPGSGKSFGVKQLVDQNEVPIRTFNLSEVAEDALPGFFHDIRDSNLKGKTPLCFFDEFDSDKLSWLSRFLAPMQDGEFRDKDGVHPVGSAIFVFAGGTSDDFEGFEKDSDSVESKSAKKRDFISRLSGYIDVRGPNQSEIKEDQPEDPDSFYILRRALLLRSFLERDYTQLLRTNKDDTHIKVASVDRNLIHGFLNVDKYKHGARSLELLLRMFSNGHDNGHLTVSDAPDQSQMSLHVDPASFLEAVFDAK